LCFSVGGSALAACGGGSASGPSGDQPDASSMDAASPYAAECVNAAVPPMTIECTGLYTDVAAKVVAPGIKEYAPAVALWADYATKVRWIYLPPGRTIDTTDPNNWVFPVGTKVWKEFSRDGKRVETRLWEKVQATYWVRATYAWSADETTATASGGADIPWAADGGTYHIPSGEECDQCHNGRADKLLGFEQVSLGLSGAMGLTLAELTKEHLLSPAVASTSLRVGDDGTGLAAAPLSWLHINCGVSCHNDNPAATGYGSDMRLRLDPSQLDGRSSADFPTRTTTLGQLANNPMWNSEPRIEPGDATHSLLVKLITNRGTDNPADNQMPPIASSIVDPNDTPGVIAWINAMPPLADAGPGDDAGGD
jgi:hypothetical protein